MKKIVGWLAFWLMMLMLTSFVDQIRLNLDGQPSSVIMPVMMMINCVMWTTYGFLLSPKSKQIIIGNSIGTVIAFVTEVTALWGPEIKQAFLLYW